MQPFVGHTQAVRCVAFTSDGGTLVSGGDDGKIIVWDRDTARPKFTLKAGFAPVLSVACHPDGERMLSGYRYPLALRDTPDRLRFWDLDTGKPSEAVDKDRSLWHRAERLATGPVVQELVVRACDTIRDVQFRHDGNSFLFLHHERVPYSDDTTGRPELLQIEPRPEQVEPWLYRRTRVTSLALSRDGDSVAVASREYVRVGRLDARTVPPGYAARGHVQSLSLSPSGDRLAGCWGDAVTVWETAGGREVRDFAGHAGAVEAVAYKPDGSLIASAGLDGRVMLWEPHGGVARAAYDWNLGPVHALAFSPDCLTLAVAGKGGLVLIDLE